MMTNLQQQLIDACDRHQFSRVQTGYLLGEVNATAENITLKGLWVREPKTPEEAELLTGWDLFCLFASADVYPAVRPDPFDIDTWQWTAAAVEETA